MILHLQRRLGELQFMLDALAPDTASQSESLEYLQMQTYILGFNDASRIALKARSEECGLNTKSSTGTEVK